MTIGTSTRAARPRLLRILATGIGSAMVLAAASGSLRPASVLASPTNSVTVSTAADVSDGVTTSIAALIGSPGADGKISLREAITAADNTVGVGAVTVNVPAGNYTLTSGALPVGTLATSSVSVVGAGAASTTITGDGTNRVLALDPNLVGNVTVTISGVTITGGHDQDGFGGAGIIGGNPSPPDTTTLSNCAVTGNHTTSSATNSPGGGIQYIGGSLSISNCTISNNSSGSSPGGGIDFETLTPHVGTFMLTNSTVTGNTLTNTDPAGFVGGAGVHVQAMTGSTVTMIGDTFTNNVATGSGTGPVGGGGLWLEGAATVTSATFTGNQANGPASTLAGGGALNLSTGSTTLAFSRITGNSASHGAGGVENNGAEAVTTATDNWWGCNAGPGNSGCDATANSGSGTGSLTVNPRLVLAVTAAPTKLIAGLSQTSAISTSLTHDSSTPSVDTSGSGHVPDGIGVSYSGVLGGVLPTAGTLSGGTASTTFTGGAVPGAGSASATVDNQTVTAGIGIGVPPHITSAGSTIFTSGSLNTFHVTANGTPGPTFSETGALPGGVTLNSGGVLTGTPAHGTSEGTYPITITATNGYGTDDTLGFTLTVVQAPVITSATSTSFTEAVAGSFPVTATGTPPVSFTESGTLPIGVTLNSATGVLAGTPAPGSNGTYVITLTAHNAALPDANQSFTLTVGLPPVITSLASGTLTTGTNGSFQVTATGYPAPTFTETGSLPTGVTLNATTGALGGTPAAGTGGQYPITLTASNGFGVNASQGFTLTVDQAPGITSAAGTTFTTGTGGTFTVTATGYPAPSFSASALPSGVGLDPTTGVLGGTPAALTGGAHPITITASNGVTPDATQGFTLTVDDAAAFTSGIGATFTAGSAATFAVTATGYPAPAYSEAGTLPSGVSLDPTTGALSGTPAVGTGGIYDLTLTAHNGIGTDAVQAFVLTVDEAPAFSSAASTTFTVGAAGGFTVSATAAPAATLSESGTLPAGVTFTLGTGVLAGTPTASSGGSYPLIFTAHNGIGSDAVQHFTLTVNEAPAITSDAATTFIVGQSGTFTVTGGGFPSPSFSESGALPSGVTLDAGTGVLSGTPGPGTNAVYPLTITAHNGVQPDATQTFTLTVNLPTQPPAITSAASTGFTEGSAGSFTVTATGLPAPGLGEAGTLPPGVTFDTTTGVLSGTPATLSNGTYIITFTAHNGIGQDATQGFTLTVGLPPTFSSGNADTFTVGTAGSFTVAANGFPAPSITESGALPGGVGLDPVTHVLGGTPAPGSGGPYTITFTASNGFGSGATQSFTLTVNEAPQITSGASATFTTGTAGSFTVLATGYPAPAFSETGAPAAVTLDPTTGVLSGTPAAHTGGVHTLTLTASNGIGRDATQPFILTVNEAASITSPDKATFTVGSAGSLTLAGGGYPVPTFGETGLLPSGVTLAGGVLSGTPAAGTGGTFDLTLTAHNGIGTDVTQAFVLTVDEAPAFTSADNTTFTVGAPGTFTVHASGVPAPTLSLTAGTLPSGVTFNAATGVLAGTPAAHAGTTYTVDITAHNGIGSDAVQHLTLTVNEAPAITSAISTTFVVGSPGTFTVVAGGFPAPTLSESPGDTLPGGVTFNPATGVLAGTPAAGSAADYTLNFTAHNSTQPDATQSFVLHVGQVPAFTSDDHTTFTVGSPGTPLTVQASGFPAPTLTLSGGTLPNGVTFDAGTGVLSGTPTAGTGGVHALTFTAANGVQPDAVQSFTLSVDEAPAITSANNATFTAGGAGSFTVTATGFPVPALSETGDTLPSGVTFNPVTGVLGGTPAALSGGTYTLTFTASNLIGSDATQTFTLTVDQAPAFTSADHATLTAGGAGSFTVRATGFPAPALSENAGDTLPSGVTFNPATGILSGTPAAGTGGTSTLTFTASNQIGPDATQTFTLTVDEAPLITSPDTTVLTTGTPVSFALTATGFPVPTLGEIGTLPSGVGFDPTTGGLTGTPAPGSAGDYPITFTAQNGVPGNAAQSFTLTVRNGTTTSIASSKAHSVLGQPVTFTATVVAGTGTPTGKVLFMDGAATVGGGNLVVVGGADIATYTTSSLTAGGHSIFAIYAGDATDTTSTSAALTQLVTTVASVTVTPHSHTLRANGTAHTSVTALVIDSGGQPVVGDSVSFTSTPGGAMSFSPASAITDSHGVAISIATASTTAGRDTITATESLASVQGTAIEKLLGVRFKAAALTSSHIAANGVSTTTATVTVVDGSGAPASDEAVTFQTEGHPGDATPAQPSVLTDSNGVATDAITSSTTAGTQAITVADDNADAGDNFSALLALTQLPAGGSTNSSFIHNAYVTLLGRDADPAGYAFWLNLLDHGTPRSALAQALASSPEYRSDVIGGTSTVPGLYEQYLGRPSDLGGVVFWLGEMAAGHSFEQVRLGFLNSAEYVQHHGNDPAAVIDALYEDILGRPSDPTGKAYWLANYNTTTIATQFISSPEGRTHLVSALYGSILDRAPDATGVIYWTQALMHGATDEYIIGALLGSDEYFLTH